MKRTTAIAILIVLAVGADSEAGALAGGKWTPSGCGTRPDVPPLDSSSVDAYNASLKEIRDWQQRAQTYINCVVGEANQDNATIAETANAEQATFRTTVDQIGADAAAAKDKLDRQ